MNIRISKCADDPRKLEKTLTDILSIEARLKDDTDVIAPVLLLSLPLPPQYNYCYIPDFHRSYFIVESSITVGKQYEIRLKCDVLRTYRSNIKQSAAIIRRSSNLGNKLIPDNIPLLAKRQYIYKNFVGGDLDTFGSENINNGVRNYLLTTL